MVRYHGPETIKGRLNFKEKITAMKKLMTIMLGLAFLTATVAVSFAQDTKSDSTMKKKKGKKGSTTKSGSTGHNVY